MPDSIWGISNTTDAIIVVGLQFDDDLVEVLLDATWPLQKGDRAEAYRCMHERIVDELCERKVKRVVIKGSIPPVRSAQLVHLHTAELRGVIMAAASQAQTQPKMITKTTMSKTFGSRKTKEYVEDAAFWTTAVSGSLRAGSRETAMLVLMAHKS